MQTVVCLFAMRGVVVIQLHAAGCAAERQPTCMIGNFLMGSRKACFSSALSVPKSMIYGSTCLVSRMACHAKSCTTLSGLKCQTHHEINHFGHPRGHDDELSTAKLVLAPAGAQQPLRSCPQCIPANICNLIVWLPSEKMCGQRLAQQQSI